MWPGIANGPPTAYEAHQSFICNNQQLLSNLTEYKGEYNFLLGVFRKAVPPNQHHKSKSNQSDKPEKRPGINTDWHGVSNLAC